MPSGGSRYQPTFLALESRLVLSHIPLVDFPAAVASTSSTAQVSEQGTTQGLGRPIATTPSEQQATLSVLSAFTKAFLTTPQDPLFNPAVDVNHNGLIGIGDGRILLDSLPPLSKKVPLRVTLTLSRSEGVFHNVPSNSGDHTQFKTVTILGHTTPGALIFSDNSTGDYKFRGPATVADAKGNFSFTVTNTQGINNNDFLVVDAYGQQLIRDDPIFWLPFAASGSKLK
jgi:hypothetical protein